MKGLEVTSIQRACVYDGHGVRTTIFFKGCPFKCPWCCNPETLNGSLVNYIDESKCLKNQELQSPLCINCERYGGIAPLLDCPFGVCTPTAKKYDNIQTLVNEILLDKSLFKTSGGGVTLSGGDPLINAEQLLPFLQILKNESISCSIETTLYYKNTDLLNKMVPLIDEWIIDLKLQEENYRQDYMEVISGNLQILRDNNLDLRIRLVYIESLNAEKVIQNLGKLRINVLELIKCHSLSKNKYRKLGLRFQDYTPSDESYLEFIQQLRANRVNVYQLKI